MNVTQIKHRIDDRQMQDTAKAVATRLGSNDDVKLQQDILRIVRNYRKDKAREAGFDRAAARKWLKKIEKAASTLADLLEADSTYEEECRHTRSAI